MKKLIFLLVILMSVTIVNAQKNKRTSAFNYHKSGKLDKAKEYIDQASENASTINDARTWYYRGNIYLDIARTQDEKYKNLDPDALQKAYEAYNKCLELDKKKEYFNELSPRILLCGEEFYNKAASFYNINDYNKSMQYFEKAFEINKTTGKIDTTAIYNAAISAELAKNYDKTIEFLKYLINLNYNKPTIYSSLSNIYKSENDTIKALEIVMEGREKYPDDFSLIITETNIYLSTGETEKALSNLELAIQKDTTNPTIYYAVATNYDALGDFDKAENAYMKAIKLKPDYFEPNYNLGALYVNKASDVINEANKLPLDAVDEYQKKKDEADNLLKNSLPYLEKALKMQPDDINTLVSLKEIYTRLKMNDKLKVVNAKIQELK
ncbi:MAG: tetratricopeptide repeat protein [Bacteroidales bacterium]|nr:tetratricopeptide repeat protein [Bacteroidales bacterium]